MTRRQGIPLCTALACLAIARPASAAAPDIEQVGSSWHLTFPSDVYIDTDGGALTLTG